MILKQVPEDFVVDEVPSVNFSGKGKFCVCLLKKRNRNTEEAVFVVAKALGIPRGFISYAGTKDKKAVTSQFVSVKCSLSKIRGFFHDDISLGFVDFHDEPISLGVLKGNNFRVVVRGLSGDESLEKKDFVNFFDSQRFSSNNVVIGKALVKKKYKDAVSLLLEDKSWGSLVEAHLKKSGNDFVGALRVLPKKVLSLYVHAYQSLLWNEVVKTLLEQGSLPSVVPIPGFSGVEGPTRGVWESVLSREGVVFGDFLNKDISYLCVEGALRSSYCDVKDFVIGDFLDDDLNPGKKKVVLSFFLGKGQYATNVVKQLFLG